MFQRYFVQVHQKSYKTKCPLASVKRSMYKYNLVNILKHKSERKYHLKFMVSSDMCLNKNKD